MVKLAETTQAPTPKTRAAWIAALIYAGILVVMAVAQLFKFEEFLILVKSFGLTGGDPMAVAIVSILVTAEVAALPFLLRMYLSPLMRIVSMLLGWVVAGIWLYLMVALSFSVNAVSDSGFLGTALEVPFGWWSVVFALGLAVLTGVASWGMWPLGRRRRQYARS